MGQNREIILQGLQELSNARQSAPDAWVTFEANGNEHWLQCLVTQLNMDWPFSSAPTENENLKVCFGSGGLIEVHDWKADSHVTFTPAVKDVDSLVRGIDSAFEDLFDLGEDYTLSYRIENG